MTMLAHATTRWFSPDTIAETVDGITAETYKELWSHVDNPDRPVENTIEIWHLLSEEARTNINESLLAKDAAFDIEEDAS